MIQRLLVFSLVILLGVGNSAFAQTPQAAKAAPLIAAQSSGTLAAPNTLQNGTAVKLRLAENLTSATAKAGQQVSLEVLEEVDVEGVPVIAKGAQALATVTTAEPRRSMGRAGKLDVNIDSVRLIDGEKAALSATQNAKGGGHTGAMTVGMVGTALVFFPAAPLLLFIHGKDITIPQGTPVTAFVAGDMKLDMSKFKSTDAPGAAGVAPPTAALAPAAPAIAQSSLTVDASVPNCDIEIDGNFAGNTPSTLMIASGKHEVTVTKTGYTDWSRSMMVGLGSVRLSADMTAKKAP